jgi:hypothetical protein
MKTCVRTCLKRKKGIIYSTAFTAALLLASTSIFPQDGAAGAPIVGA